jgi:hypothetical protein
MANETLPVISLASFQIKEVVGIPTTLPTAAPSLGPLAAFVGDWKGNGFNTIFRPDSTKTPTPLPVPPTDGVNDNILELKLSISGSIERQL